MEYQAWLCTWKHASSRSQNHCRTDNSNSLISQNLTYIRHTAALSLSSSVTESWSHFLVNGIQKSAIWTACLYYKRILLQCLTQLFVQGYKFSLFSCPWRFNIEVDRKKRKEKARLLEIDEKKLLEFSGFLTFWLF